MSAAWTAPPIPPATTRATASAVMSLRRRDRFVRLEEAERIAFAVLAMREPADVRDRLLVLRFAAELPDLRQVGLDVLGVEVDDRPPLVALLRVDRAAPAVLLEHAVIEPLHPGVADRPAGEGLPEPLRAVGVLRGKLDVHDLLGHRASFSAHAIRSRDGQSNRSLRRRARSRAL